MPTLTDAARASIGQKNKMIDAVKAKLGNVDEAVAASSTAVVVKTTDKKIIKVEGEQQTDLTQAVIDAGTPSQWLGDARSAEIGHDGRSTFTRGAASVRVTGHYTDKRGKQHDVENLVSLNDAAQKVAGKTTWVRASQDPAGSESLAMKLANQIGGRVRTVGEDGKGHYVMTSFDKATGDYRRLLVDKSAELKFTTSESRHLEHAKQLVRDLESERGHDDVKSVDLVRPTYSGDGVILEVNYATDGKKPRQFEVDFGHPGEVTSDDLVMHYNEDSNGTDRNTKNMVLKATASLVSDHSWVYEAHRIPSMTSDKGTVLVAFQKQGWGQQEKTAIGVQRVTIDPINRSSTAKWDEVIPQGQTWGEQKDYAADILAAVTAKTGKPAFLGSHLSKNPAGKENNTELAVITKNGNVRVHSDGKDYVVDMESLLAGKAIVMPDTSAKSMRTGSVVNDG